MSEVDEVQGWLTRIRQMPDIAIAAALRAVELARFNRPDEHASTLVFLERWRTLLGERVTCDALLGEIDRALAAFRDGTPFVRDAAAAWVYTDDAARRSIFEAQMQAAAEFPAHGEDATLFLSGALVEFIDMMDGPSELARRARAVHEAVGGARR